MAARTLTLDEVMGMKGQEIGASEWHLVTQEEINKFADDENPEVVPHDEHDVSKLDHVTIKRSVLARKGKWRRFSEESRNAA